MKLKFLLWTKLGIVICVEFAITEDAPIKFRPKRLILGDLLNPVHPILADISIITAVLAFKFVFIIFTLAKFQQVLSSLLTKINC